MTTPEGKVINSFLAKAKAVGYEVRKCAWEGRRGAPDRLVFAEGRHFWVEFKAPGENLRPHQVREIARMRAAGCKVYVLDTQDVDILSL